MTRRRQAIVWSAPVLALVALWCVWAWIAHTRLQSRLEAIRAKGQPVTDADLPHGGLPNANDPNNFLWQAALARLQVISTSNGAQKRYMLDPFPAYPSLPLDWLGKAMTMLPANERVLSLVHDARTHGQKMGGINDDLATLILTAAVSSHLQGNDGDAMDRILDGLYAAGLSRNMSGVFIQRDYMLALRAMAPDLQVGGDSAATSPTGAVPRGAFLELIRQLPNEQQMQQDLQAYLSRDEAFMVTSEADDDENECWLLRPMFELSEVRHLDQIAIAQRALMQPDWQSSQAVMAELPTPEMSNWGGRRQDPPRYSRIFVAGRMLASYNENRWRMIVEVRTAVLCLAVRLYRIDHGGWPTKLSALVPDYLPAVPADPFESSGTPIGYTMQHGPDGGDRPMLILAAPSATTAMRPPAKPAFQVDPWFDISIKPIWIDLSRWNPDDAKKP